MYPQVVMGRAVRLLQLTSAQGNNRLQKNSRRYPVWVMMLRSVGNLLQGAERRCVRIKGDEEEMRNKIIQAAS